MIFFFSAVLEQKLIMCIYITEYLPTDFSYENFTAVITKSTSPCKCIFQICLPWPEVLLTTQQYK